MISRSIPTTQTTPPSRVFSLIGLILCLVVLMTINVALSSELASVGLALNISQQQSAQLEQATSRLRQELVRSTSLADLDKQAVSLGFTAIDRYHTLTTVHPVAYGATIPLP